MSEIFEQMLQQHTIEGDNDRKNALYEVMQQVVLSGLYRGGFFKEAAFYGGTCLRIFHGLRRYSEDMDFSLLKKNSEFTLETYFPAIIEEARLLGRTVTITKKDKRNFGKVESAFKLSEQDFVNMHKNLGIVYDCDLRSSAETESTESPLGQSVSYRRYNLFSYTSAFSGEGKAAMKELFTDLSDASHYPMYMHCAYGKDRTGTACFILEALLGLSKENIIKEYQLTGLAFSGTETVGVNSDFGKFISEFEKLPGNNYREKAEGYLLSCGLTEETLEKIKDIFLN